MYMSLIEPSRMPPLREPTKLPDLLKSMRDLTVCVIVPFLVWLNQPHFGAFCEEIPRASCDAGTVYAGQNASVTCKFPTDVGAEKGDVFVQWQPAYASKDAPRKEALSCGWLDKNPNCVVKKGFIFNGTITSSLTLVIPNVDKDYAGTYFCFLASLPGTPPEECKLIVIEHIPTTATTTTATTTTNGSISPSRVSEMNEGHNTWLLPLIVVISVAAVLSFLGYVVFRHRKSISRWLCGSQTSRLGEEEGVANPLLPSHLNKKQIPIDKKIKDYLECFELSADDCDHVKRKIEEELEQVSNDRPDSSVVSTVQLSSLPNGKENGAFVVIDLSSTTLRVHHVKLRHPKPDTIYKSYPIPPTARLGPGIQLFDFIVESVDKFLHAQNISKKRRGVGLVFSFPCQYLPNFTEARLVKWTGGFQCEDAVHKNIKELLQQAMDRKMTACRLDMVLVTNDAAATLLSVAHKDCRVSLTLENGFHACYMEKEKDSAERSTETAHDMKVLVNTDLGSLGANGSLESLQSDYDKDLDKYSLHPKTQILEKMVSLSHIGEVVRRVLVTLAKKGVLFKYAPDKSVLSQKECFTADYISLIERDDGDRCLNTDFVLRELQLESFDEEDCRIVHAICLSVMKRSAHLAGIGLAAVINRMDVSGKITVAVDGSPYRYFPLYHQQMCEKANELLKPKVELELLPVYHGCAIGASRTVAVLRPFRRKSAKTCVSMN